MAVVSITLVDDYLSDCEIRGMAKDSIPRYRSTLGIFQAFMVGRGSEIQEADGQSLRDFIEYLRKERRTTQKTIETYFSVLSSFYDFLAFEGVIDKNPVPPIRKRYLKRYKDNGPRHERQLITVEDAGRLVRAALIVRDKAIIALLFKTGIRRGELVSLDVSDVDLIEGRLKLKPTAKRSNRVLFLDEEGMFLLKRWLRVREGVNRRNSPALFLSTWGYRISRTDVYELVTQAAERAGLHDPTSPRMEDHFSPHCCRHWFTTHLRRAGMAREFIQELRGDSRREAIDIYDHIDEKELKDAYLAAIPRLRI
ncbi:MAG: putative tyrosine recombinase XerC-like protein [Methanosaeta sp. PtaB.Bin039]|nr:MAG: putative tyrosine recombinase XerC-like protein [Methanosaeta sp. PtaB.Bin039]